MRIQSLPHIAQSIEFDPASYSELGYSQLPMESWIPSDQINIEKIVYQVYQSPSISVGEIVPLPGHQHPIYRITLSSTLPAYHGVTLILKLSPPFQSTQITYQQEALRTESLILGIVGADGVIPTPSCIRSEMQPQTIDSPFLLTTRLPGACLRNVDYTFTASDRNDIDRQLGFFMYKISRQRLPVFGHPLQVASGAAHNSWHQAFMSILDALLVDAEDMMLSLPYAQIKQHVNRLSPVLNGISDARLVMISLGSPESVFVDETTKEVTGILDFSNVVWGDPLFARMFTSPSPAMLEGFGRPVATYGPERLRRTLYAPPSSKHVAFH